MEYDAVIIGAGFSGLAAGIRLAGFGLRVLLLEKHDKPGGLNSWYERKGQLFETGLHALTNHVPRKSQNTPLSRILRRLRIPYDSLKLAPQNYSSVIVGDAKITFDNNPRRLLDEAAAEFPRSAGGLRKLFDSINSRSYDESLPLAGSARKFLAAYIPDARLRELLLTPLLFYGSAREDDMDLGQFIVMFKSVFIEGLSRPEGGIRAILELFTDRFKECGGELRFKCPVEELVVRDGAVIAVKAGGEKILCRQVYSSAGLPETASLIPVTDRLTDSPLHDDDNRGKISLVESIGIMDRPAAEIGEESSIVFFADDERLRYRRPSGEVDLSSGVVCFTGNFRYADRPDMETVRVSHLASYPAWKTLNRSSYRSAGKDYLKRSWAAAIRHVADFRPHVWERKEFITPLTLERFTGRHEGALYGTPRKLFDGRTGYRNLFLTGSDTGLVGVIGACLGGITAANSYGIPRI